MKGGRRAGEGKHAKQMGEFLAACEMDWESGRSYSRYQGGRLEQVRMHSRLEKGKERQTGRKRD